MQRYLVKIKQKCKKKQNATELKSSLKALEIGSNTQEHGFCEMQHRLRKILLEWRGKEQKDKRKNIIDMKDREQKSNLSLIRVLSGINQNKKMRTNHFFKNFLRQKYVFKDAWDSGKLNEKIHLVLFPQN